MRWQISVGTGWSLGPFKKNMRERIGRAAARATDKAAQGARDDIRASMRSQRLGGLANTVAATSDLKRGRPQGRGGEVLDVAGFVTLRGIKSQRTAGALDSYLDNDSTDIKPVKGNYLWASTPEIPRFAGRKRMTPSLYYKSGLAAKIGKLVPVKGKRPGEMLLVVPDANISLSRPGKIRPVPKSGRVREGRARVGIVAFVGFRQTRRSRRVDPRAVAEKWQQKLSRMFADEMTG